MNCLLYARVSTDKQAQKDLSIPAQLQFMKDYAKKQDWKVVGHFIDEGESAKTANRPELKRLIQYCKDNKDVDMVLVHKIDRLARNLVDFATIKAILKQKGIRLISVSEQFEDNPIGQLLENILASISEWYSANLGEEVKKASFAKLQKGEWPQRPPIGYKSVKEVEDKRVKHVPDEKTAPLVRQAYELFSTGNYSLQTLSEEMANRGLKTKYNRIFSPESIKRLLTNRFYIGRLEWQGKEHQGIHTPIIPKELFYQVQEVLKKRSSGGGEKGTREFLLRGIAYCQICQQKLTGEIHPRGSYYRCIPCPHKEKCPQPYTPVSLLDNQLEGLYAQLQPPKKLLDLIRLETQEITQKRERITHKEIKTLQQTIAQIEDKEMKLLDEKLSGQVPTNVYEKVEKKYREKRRAAETRLSQFEVDYKDPLDFLDKCIVISSMLLFLHQKFNYEHQKNLEKALFERIYVKNKEIVGVQLNPPFSFLLGDQLNKLFKHPPSGGAEKDVFEQLIQFTLSEKYLALKSLIELLSKKMKPLLNND